MVIVRNGWLGVGNNQLVRFIFQYNGLHVREHLIEP